MSPKVKYDVTDSDPERATRGVAESPKPGMYVAKIEDCNIKYAKDENGRPDKAREQVEAVLKVVKAAKPSNEKYKDSRLWYYFPTANNATGASWMFRADAFLMAIGVAGKKNKRKGSFDTKDAKNKRVLIVVRAGTNQAGEYRGDIAQVLAYDEDAWKEAKKRAKSEASTEDDDEDIEDLDESVDEDETSEDDEEDEEDKEDEDEDDDESSDEDEDEEPDLDTLGEEADDGDDDAIEKLEDLAEEAELDPNDFDTWAELAAQLAKPKKKSKSKKSSAKSKGKSKGGKSKKKSKSKKGSDDDDDFPFD